MIGVGIHDCTYAYPSFEDFACAAKNLVAKLRGDTAVDLACAAHCSYVCVGYALSHIPHDHPPIMAGVVLRPDGDVAAILEGAAAACAPEAVGAINWALILDLAVALLKKWLAA